MILEELVLKSHVRLGLEANASAKDVGQSSTLLGKRIDNRGTGRCQRSFQHVAEHAENTVEVLVTPFGTRVLPLNARHHFGEHDEINDERGCKKRIFANVEQPINKLEEEKYSSVI